MKPSFLLRLAGVNLLAKKRFSAKVIRSITVIAVLAITLLLLCYTLHRSYDTSLSEAASENHLNFSVSLGTDGLPADKAAYEALLSACAAEPHLGTPAIIGDYQLPEELITPDMQYASLRYVTALIDGTAYQGIDDLSNDFFIAPEGELEPMPVFFAFQFIDASAVSYTTNTMAEARYRSGKNELFLCGRDIAAPNELIMTDYMLAQFGYAGNPEALLGKTVSFVWDGKDILEEFTLVGVADAALHRTWMGMETAQLLVGADTATYAKYGVENLELFYPVDSFLYTEEAAKRIIAQSCPAPYYACDTADYVYVAKVQALVDRIVTLFCGLLTLALLLNLCSSIRLSLLDKRHYFGMCKANGMRAPDLRRMTMAELLLLTLLSTLLAAGISYGLLMLLNYILQETIGLGLTMTVPQFLLASALVWGGITALLCGISALFLNGILRKSAAQNLS